MEWFVNLGFFDLEYLFLVIVLFYIFYFRLFIYGRGEFVKWYEMIVYVLFVSVDK